VFRHRVLRVLTVVSVVAVLIISVVGAAALTLLRRPLPDPSGTLSLTGLRGSVTIERDERGVPSIYAGYATDLFEAQGFVDAQDNFFLMDFRRHVTAGRLAELVGGNERALRSDAVIRTLGWRRVASAEWALLDDRSRSYLQAYADGVNAYLSTRSADSLAVEYSVLGLQVPRADPAPWDPVDSLAWLKAMAWDLRSNDRDERARVEVYRAVRDVRMVQQLFPAMTVADPIVSGEATTVSNDFDVLVGADVAEAMRLANEALAAVPTLVGEGEGIGSNSWAVSGDLTESGSPILANDPHLGLSIPGVFTQVGLHCRSVSDECPFDVSGFSFAGMPGVIIGHNADLAWGLTNMGADTSDFFIERTNRNNGTYRRDGEDVPIESRTEIIEVAGGDPIELAIRETVHGPIISGVLGALSGAPLPSGGVGSSEVAMRWTALEPGNTAAAIFAMDTASDAADIAAAAQMFDAPAQNIVFATTDGHIGYQAPGLVPVRTRIVDGLVPSDGTWPRPGWDSRYDWQGWVPAAQMPAVLDPPEGYIVAANQQVSEDSPTFFGPDADYGFRAARIGDLLQMEIASQAPITVESVAQMQLDNRTALVDSLLPALLAAPVQDEFTQEAVDLLKDWDGQMDPDSPAAAYFAAVWSVLLHATFADDLPESQWPDGGDRWYAVVSQLLEAPDSPWWDDRTTVNLTENRDQMLSNALTQARLDLTVELGKDPRDWDWGRLHKVALHHPVLGDGVAPWPISAVVDPAPVSVGGGSSIVDAMSWDAASGSFEVTTGPAMRMVVDTSDWDTATWVMGTGNSGRPGSAHYTDQIAAWAAGRQYPWPFTKQAVADASVDTLVLEPIGG
jgi:penicillin G amidase